MPSAKTGTKHAAAARKGPLDRSGETSFLRLAREAFRQRRIAPRRLDDQHVDVRFRKDRAFEQRLVVEIHIAGVKNGAPFRAEQNSSGTEHMAGVAIFKTQLILRPGRAAFAIHREGLAERTMLPPIRRPIRLAMGEERIDHAHLLAFARHHVDRVVEQRLADRRRRLGHENARLRLLPHQHRERANVIEMRVREEQGIDRTPRQHPEERQRHFALLLRVHAAIQHDPLPACPEIITIGADLRPARQIDEFQNRAPTCPLRFFGATGKFIPFILPAPNKPATTLVVIPISLPSAW